jgi:hypothetical protein
MADKTAQELCEAALRKNRVIDPGETAPTQDLADTFEELIRMLHSWSADGLFVYVAEEDTHTLAAGTASYTIGSGGDIDTDRPINIRPGTYVRANGLDMPLKIVGLSRYNRYLQKTVGADYPSSIMYLPEYPLGKLYLWPPGGGELHLWSMKRLAQPAAVGNDTVIPEEYQDCIVWNLACRIAPEFIGDPTPFMMKMAKDTKDMIKSLNLVNDMDEMDCEVRMLNNGITSYNIDGG